MPWIEKEGARTFEAREAPVFTPPDPDAPWPDPEGAARQLREREALWIWWKRHIAEYYEIYEFCPRVICRRGHACLGPEAACHDEAFPILKAEIYPQIMRKLRGLPPPEK